MKRKLLVTFYVDFKNGMRKYSVFYFLETPIIPPVMDEEISDK